MDWSQYLIASIYAAAIGLAFWRGSISIAVACIIAGNFWGTVAANGDGNLITVVDTLTLAALVFDGSAMALALVYAFSAAILVGASSSAIGLQFSTTSAIVDAIIVPIAFIIGWSNGGGGRLDFDVRNSYRRIGGRIGRYRLSFVARYNAMFDLAGHETQDKGLRNGP